MLLTLSLVRADDFSDYFDPLVRQRGHDYITRVRVLQAEENALHLHARGAADYCLRLERNGDALGVSCSCPYFASSGACKHLWAALLFAEKKGSFAGAPEMYELADLPDWNHDDAKAPKWRQLLASIDAPLRAATESELVYVLDVDRTRERRALQLELATRLRKPNGDLSVPKPTTVDNADIATLPDSKDREVLGLLAAVSRSGYGGYGVTLGSRLELRAGVTATVLPRVAQTGQLLLRRIEGGAADYTACRFDDGPPYALHLVVTQDKELLVRGQLRREDEVIDIAEPQLLLEDGFAVFADRIARFSTPDFRWVTYLRDKKGSLRVPIADGPAFALELTTHPKAPPAELPPSLMLREVHPMPRTILRMRRDENERTDALHGALLFDYDGVEVDEHDARTRVALPKQRALLVRDMAYEDAARVRLVTAGCKREPAHRGGESWTLSGKRLGEVASELVTEGWHVELERSRFRLPGTIDVSVTTGIDWFDLAAEIHYDELSVALPRLLAAARRGSRYVELSDGSMGLLPEEWLAQHRLVGELGATNGDAVRFGKSQLGLLDALLAAMPDARIDRRLAKARQALSQFTSIKAHSAPAGFIGSLRAYQEEGLGWLEFLRDFSFGGCLADDMGLGKTIQVLALLESRRGGGKPSLVVVPKSLMFNWRREAAHFTPQLRVLEHHGTKRSLADAASYDLIVTTYGTLVRDAKELSTIELDYAILDEAQAIKNARTDSAKAARLLRADHRLVLTGTPIENRLSDLWSLFEFLNPGMLGASSVWRQLAAGDGEERALLARALRPFLLRRTKSQVAADLPEKTEQIIYCELEGDERKHYDELRAHYRQTLLGIVEKKGINRSQIHILEALLRLRQAACHPALVDPSLQDRTSAKLGALLGQLDEVIAGGHKAVVFSQFTSLLSIVRAHLDKAGIAYESLEGKTRDRQARVDRFQNDTTCPVFLVSLKAGGVGLNLTAAEYVFLLDPWWNPAVEAQAIDRAHRLGQTKPVIAYRLIGKGTIEEKVMELQRHKRALADSILNETSVIGAIGKEELELLLS